MRAHTPRKPIVKVDDDGRTFHLSPVESHSAYVGPNRTEVVTYHPTRRADCTGYLVHSTGGTLLGYLSRPCGTGDTDWVFFRNRDHNIARASNAIARTMRRALNLI